MATAVDLLPREYGYVVLVLVLYTFLNFWMAGKVGKARKMYKVPYPALYASESDNKDAKVFNCVQRGHQNSLELMSLFFVLLLLGGLKHPCISAGLGLLYTVTCYFYFKGYSTSDPQNCLLVGKYGFLALLGHIMCTISFGVALHLTDARAAAEAKRMSESSKRRLMDGKQAQQQTKMPKAGASVQKTSALEPTESELEHQTLGKRKKLLDCQALPRRLRHRGKRPVIDLEKAPLPKMARIAELPRAVFVIEDEELMAPEPVTIVVPPKTVQFANHMIIGSQMNLTEIEELPKRALREEAGRTFRLQASASIDMWLCMKRAISAAEWAKKARDDGRLKVVEAEKILQGQATLLKDKEAAERQLMATEVKLAEMRMALD